jgi:Leucine-rich repeat (LRR) protein
VALGDYCILKLALRKPPSDWSGLIGLISLELTRNNLTTIDSDDFAGLENLEELRLNGNALLEIESGAFSHLGNLRILNLSGTGLATINLTGGSLTIYRILMP